MCFKNDTIVSRVTPEVRCGIGIIRVSGKLASNVAVKILGKQIPARYASYLPFLNSKGSVLDRGIALRFEKPFSFTGEDVLELQGHGNPIIIDLLISEILSISGIRLAKPGEFSERAFLNGKIDLVQAESIVDLINASSQKAVSAALQSLDGMFSTYINSLIQRIKKLRIKIEALINFSEDEVNFNVQNIIKCDLENILKTAQDIYLISAKGNVLNEGVKVVISGDPNSGKSSLFNVLSLVDRSIVTSIPGTTRDIIYETININGVSFRLADTAGLRITSNVVETIGINRAWKEINSADHVLFVVDGTLSFHDQMQSYNVFSKLFLAKSQLTLIFNKCDDSNFKINSKLSNLKSSITISNKTKFGIEKLRRHLYDSLKFSFSEKCQEGVFLARRRHLNIILKVLKIIKKSKKMWKCFDNIELLAEDLKLCQNLLGEITGVYSSNQLLSDIFSNFCIGK